MHVLGFTALSLAIMAAGASVPEPTASLPTATPAATATDVSAAVAPFSAHYQADWNGINIGTSDLDLKPDTEPGHYVYTWTITARGIFRLYRDKVTQKSWLSVAGSSGFSTLTGLAPTFLLEGK